MGGLVTSGGGVVPAYKRQLVNSQRVAFAASITEDGWPVASLLTSGDARPLLTADGEAARLSVRLPSEAGPGFVCPSLRAHLLRPDAPAAFVAMDFESRLRFRVQGRVAAHEDARQPELIELACSETFPNCSAFIPKIELATVAAAARPQPSPAVSSSLSDEQAALVGSVCSFFVASAAPVRRPTTTTRHTLHLPSTSNHRSPRRCCPPHLTAGWASQDCASADISHRGGQQGFLRVRDDGATLSWPDYPGNVQ